MQNNCGSTEELHKVTIRKVTDDAYGALAPWRAQCSCGIVMCGGSQPAAFDAGWAHAQAARQGPVDLVPLARTRLAWDLLDHEHIRDWMLRLGLSPADMDIEELEHKEAHARAEALAPLAALAETYSAIVAEISAEYMAWRHEQDSGEEPLPQHAKKEYVQVSYRMIRSAVFAILAEFLADGVVVYGPAAIQRIIQEAQ